MTRAAIRQFLIVALIAIIAAPASAATQPGVEPGSPLDLWLRSLRDDKGTLCCDNRDCRRTQIRPDGRGGAEAWIGRTEYGPTAPDEWRPIPPVEFIGREDRPKGVRGAWVCFYADKVACADVEAGG